MDVYAKLKELGLTLPEAPAKGGLYTPAVRFSGNLVYLSGCGPIIGDNKVAGKLGQDFTTEQGQVFSRDAVLNLLSVLENEVGDLNRVKRAVKILAFVASDDNFFEQPQVANGGSQLLGDLFGKENLPARSAIGVNVLPGNLPVEIEAIFEVE